MIHLLTKIGNCLKQSREDIGSTGFKVTLEANSRYAIDISLYFPDDDGNMVWSGQLKVIGGSGWSSNMMVHFDNLNHLRQLIDINIGTTSTKKLVSIGLATELGLFYEHDSGSFLIETLQIRGHIDTDEAGELKLEFRNVTREGTDGLRNAIIRQGSYIKAIKCEIN